MKLYVKRFEELSVDDLYSIMKVRSEVFVVEQKIIYVDQDGKDKFAYHVYIKDKEEIVAYLRVLDKGISDKNVAIGRVLTTKRGLGLGKKIVEEGLKVAHDLMRAEYIFIEAQSYLLRFYKSLGFIQTSEEFMDEGILHVNMVLDLKAK